MSPLGDVVAAKGREGVMTMMGLIIACPTDSSQFLYAGLRPTRETRNIN
ncbi:hypothetical protein GCM10022252_20880 [Streptosporangium oxazolinicum]|uniref:Transposase n=1 Tax=Streptosporangium oxazolinicum TaxID=909287 RepID=A0ABP8APK1_9ACTN